MDPGAAAGPAAPTAAAARAAADAAGPDARAAAEAAGSAAWTAATAWTEALDPADLAAARWFGGKGRPFGSARALDALDLGDGAHLAIVEIAYLDEGDAERYLVPLGAPGDSPAWGRLLAFMHELADVGGRRGRFVGLGYVGLGPVLGRGDPGRLAVRPGGTDQSHDALVVGERVFLKVRRRLSPPGQDAEGEMSEALETAAHFRDTPRLLGRVTWAEGGTPGEQVDLVLAFEHVPGSRDAFEWLNGLLQATFRGDAAAAARSLAAADRLGALVARLHAATRAIGEREPRLAATWPEPAVGARRLRRGEAELDRALAVLGAAEGRSARGAASELEAAASRVRALLSPLERIPGELVRVHGDLHLGQVLRVDGPAGPADDRFMLIDFEGDPLVPPPVRREPAPPETDLATLLRSLDHVARSAARRLRPHAADRAVEAWIGPARGALVEGYVAAGGRPPDPLLLRALEVEKECRELVYAATFLPDWLYAARSGMAALLAMGEPR